MIIQLVHTGYHVPRLSRRRFWLSLGEEVELVCGVKLSVLRMFGEDQFCFEDDGIPEFTPLSVQLRTDIGLAFIPRAIELGLRDFPMRYLIEATLLKQKGTVPGLSFVNARVTR